MDVTEVAPSLTVRAGSNVVVVAPFEDELPGHESMRRALGPLFEVPTPRSDLTLELSPGTWLPAEVDVPAELQLVWLEERSDGTFAAEALPTERSEGGWRAVVTPGRATRFFAFLAHPAAPEAVECDLAFSAAAITERVSRCGEAQTARIAEVLHELCARGAEPFDLDRALGDLPCHPTPTDLQPLFRELSR